MNTSNNRVLVIGGGMAGIRTALMLTGVSRREDLARAPARPTWVVDGYTELERVLDEVMGDRGRDHRPQTTGHRP